MNNRLTQLGKRLLLLTITFFLTMGLFTAAYRFDNKYTTQSVQPINGILFYTPEKTDPVYLINGWEYYQGRLLTPENFISDLPPRTTTFISASIPAWRVVIRKHPLTEAPHTG